MRSAILFSTAMCVITCTSCSLAGARSNPSGNSSSSKALGSDSQQPYLCSTSTCQDNDVLRAVSRALDQCTATQNLYERRGFHSKTAQFVVAIVGSLAGAVAAPISKGSGVKAWAGLSGAANGIQAQLDEQYSYAVTVQDRVAVANAMQVGEVHIRSAGTRFEQIREANIMENECRQAAAKADAAILQAISAAAKVAADNDQKIVDATQKSIAQGLENSNLNVTKPTPGGTTMGQPQSPADKSNGKHNP
ncbi:hypothetical protein [Rhodanobacter sp. OR87]|uniref:hypothetical protein n=1 Tax=Rhodanobacter sp. OR87 TaxID=1076523 RepID=UPI0012DC74FB|nr:hypothetical protein [Rhodanobacter sp. OR87]